MKSATTKCESCAKRSFRYRTKNVWLYLARPAFSNKSNVFTSTRAFENVRTHIHDGICGAQCIAFIRRTTADISTFIRGLHTHTRAPDNTRWPFFLSRPHLFSILKRLISRGELLWGQIPRTANRFYRGVGNFGINSRRCANTAVSTNRRRCAPRLLFAVSRILLTSQWHSLVQYEQNDISQVRYSVLSFIMNIILWIRELHMLNLMRQLSSFVLRNIIHEIYNK